LYTPLDSREADKKFTAVLEELRKERGLPSGTDPEE